MFETKNGYKFYNNISKNLTKYIKIPGYKIMKNIKKNTYKLQMETLYIKIIILFNLI